VKRYWRGWFAALSFFTRIPCYAWGDHDYAALNRAIGFWPSVGVLVGAFAALVFMLAAQLWSSATALLISMAASILLTGALHEDGLADTLDGLGGGWDAQRRLEIMRDSRLGSYGAIGLLLVLALKFAALHQLPAEQLPQLLIAAHAFSRFCGVMLAGTQNYVRDDGKAKALIGDLVRGDWLSAAIFGLLPLIWLPHAALWGVVCAVAAGGYFGWRLRRLLGGYSGDCLGAMQQFTELAFYLGVAACRCI
jgi:adenosylcobinamide-GDP ribazoletransferase